MKPAEYAQELGISRQAVYAKIKKGILKSKNVEGKLYIVIDGTIESTEKLTTPSKNNTPKKEIQSSQDYKALLQSKDETIAVLKETVVDLKESNKQISTTLRGEIDLLKEAFHEMRILYTHQLEHKTTIEEESIEVFEQEQEEAPTWIGVKKFFKRYDIGKDKKQAKVLKRIQKFCKEGDERFIMMGDKLKIDANKTYEDIIH